MAGVTLFSDACCTLTVCALLALPGCGRSQESKVAAAIRAKYPDGRPRCLPFASGVVGIHVPTPSHGKLWYPASGPTSPLVHLFVFWAGPSTTPVPEIVADLAGRGVLAKATVQATVDAETTLPVRRATLGYATPAAYEHRTEAFQVDVYTTKPFDPAFEYPPNFTPGSVNAVSFPSRLYGDGPLPPTDQHYVVPTINPYATSVVASACFPETIDRVDEIRMKVDGFGNQYAEADVLYDQHPLAWMLTRTFQRAAIAPDTGSITKPRKATIDLSMADGKLTYVREHWR